MSGRYFPWVGAAARSCAVAMHMQVARVRARSQHAQMRPIRQLLETTLFAFATTPA